MLALDGPAYFAWAVSYIHKMLVKSNKSGNFMKTLFVPIKKNSNNNYSMGQEAS
jgi:hypothetical protein